MHNAALASLGLRDWHYQRLPLPPELFAETVRALPAAGFLGVNVTIPHKEAALALADDATDTARAVGAANTLTFRDGRIHADNTDVIALRELLGDLAGRTALVLGAGGAARAAVHALVHAGAADVMVWNRTAERAVALAAELGARAVERPPRADVVVHCTAVGLAHGQDPFKTFPVQADTFDAGSHVVDMVYSSGDTTFLAAARSRGAVVIDGLEILVAQGAASLERWTGRPAPREVMRKAAEQNVPDK
jgi:shikimate dehydrogenase